MLLQWPTTCPRSLSKVPDDYWAHRRERPHRLDRVAKAVQPRVETVDDCVVWSGVHSGEDSSNADVLVGPRVEAIAVDVHDCHRDIFTDGCILPAAAVGVRFRFPSAPAPSICFCC
jgi:hypothetical protein